MGVGSAWTDEAILRESERWVHVPRGGVRVEDGRRLLVHLPGRWDASRVWRSRAADEEQAGALIEETIDEARDAGNARLVWHTGDRIAPPFMDECLTSYGFEATEELEVLAFELGDGTQPRLPRLGPPARVYVECVRDAEGFRKARRVDSEVFSTPLPSEQEIAEHGEQLEKLRRRERGCSSEEGPFVLRFVASLNADGRDGGGHERRVVAAAGAQVVGETVRLWGAGTLAGFRGRGAYRALVLERCRVAHALGAALALTKANAATSSPILECAGFRSVGAERRLVLEIPGG